MTLTCKKCGKTGIDHEAFNMRTGGFLCRSCRRAFKVKSLFLSFGCAAIGLIAALGFIVAAVVWSSW